MKRSKVQKKDLRKKKNVVEKSKKEEIMVQDVSGLPKKDLFRVDEVAEYYSVTDRTIRLWIEHGHLDAVKKGGTIRILRKSILTCRFKTVQS